MLTCSKLLCCLSLLEQEITIMKDYADQLKEEYQRNRCLFENRWPNNFRPTHFTNLGFLILDHERTKQEAIHLAKLKHLGNYSTTAKQACETPSVDDSNDVYDTDTPIKEDIADIFSHASNGEAKILAEGAPGIGKTMLLKEIAYRWAIGDLLTNKEVLLLISLRNPRFNSVECPKDMFLHCDKYNDEENAKVISRYFRKAT